MANKLYEETNIQAIANAIRAKGQSGTMTVAQMPSKITSIPSGGITPTGNINITDTNVTDVTNYATAQVVDGDLIASNIKKDVNILGVVGSFEGGGVQGYYATQGSYAYHTEIMNFPVNVPNLSYCAHVKEIHAPNHSTTLASSGLSDMTDLEVADIPNCSGVGSNAFLRDSKLKSLFFPKVSGTKWAANGSFGYCTGLSSIQFGSIGNACAYSAQAWNCFQNCDQPLTITMYVADDEALPLQGAPWKATNATIIYRSATTGEVIEV